MPAARKVAFVSVSSTAYVHRLMRGALSHAESQSQVAIRDFRLPHLPAAASDGAVGHMSSWVSTLSLLNAWDPDGVLAFMDSGLLQRLLPFLPRPSPVVSLCPVELKPGIAVVTASFASNLKIAVRHFRELGVRSIAFLQLEREELLPSKLTERFKQIVRPSYPAEATLIHPVEPMLAENPHATVTPVPPLIAAWLRKLPKPVGVFNQDVGGGSYLIRCCHALGLRVPEEVAVIGMDDADLSLASQPTLTSVVAAGEKVGFEAMRILDDMMRGQPGPTRPVLVDAGDLQVRQSTGLKRTEICDIAGAMNYIRQHACNGLDAAKLHQATQSVSYMTFHTHFKSATGRTPAAAIRERQFEEARRLLAETELDMTLVAGQCGFGSSSDFARRFRAMEGRSPSEFRHARRTRRS